MHLSAGGADDLRVVFFHLAEKSREIVPTVLAEGIHFLVLRIFGT